jgi:hypothetical protein
MTVKEIASIIMSLPVAFHGTLEGGIMGGGGAYDSGIGFI